MEKPIIEFAEFLEIEKKLEIVNGQVVAATRIPKKDKLIKLTVIFGEKEEDEKTVVTNLGEFFEPDDFLALVFPFIVNLSPVNLGGVISEAMIMVSTMDVEVEDGVIVKKFFLDNPRIGSILL